MYTLRVLKKDCQLDTILGSQYAWANRYLNPERFKTIHKEVFPEENEIMEGLVGFVSTNHHIPIYENEPSYIMTESGKTFTKLN